MSGGLKKEVDEKASDLDELGKFLEQMSNYYKAIRRNEGGSDYTRNVLINYQMTGVI